jgi:hypothetical protein
MIDLNRIADPAPTSIARRLRQAFETLRAAYDPETREDVLCLLEDAVLDLELAIRM